MLSSYEKIIPQRLGAKNCPNCTNSNLELEIKTVAYNSHFAELICKTCFREAVSEVSSNRSKIIQQVILCWNGNWPDLSGFITGDSEGIKHG